VLAEVGLDGIDDGLLVLDEHALQGLQLADSPFIGSRLTGEYQ
jgi:hypothetical protein